MSDRPPTWPDPADETARPAGPPSGEVSIDEELVRRLLEEQHRDLAEKPIRAAGGGWDNALFRLGDDLAVRLPRREVAVRLLAHEQRWLPELAPRLPLPVPAPRRSGRPAAGYPWSWSVVPWFDGALAESLEPSPRAAGPLGRFLRALHSAPHPDAAPANPFRDVPLREKATKVEPRLELVAERLGSPEVSARLREHWTRGRDAEVDVRPRWIHGDLHPRNVLLDPEGAPLAILDWGDVTAADPATDLSALWTLLPDPESREVALRAYGPISPATRDRARGWAAFFAILFLDSGLAAEDGDPAGHRDLSLGRRIAGHLAEERD